MGGRSRGDLPRPSCPALKGFSITDIMRSKRIVGPGSRFAERAVLAADPSRPDPVNAGVGSASLGIRAGSRGPALLFAEGGRK